MSAHERSHPPTLLTLTRRALTGECSVGRGDRLLVAVSGGRDSMALLHVLARLRVTLGFELCALGVDHGLRDHAKEELAQARAFAVTLDVPFEVHSIQGLHAGGNLQERARDARHAILDARAVALGARIATAHHADDRAETVLLRMLRGGSARGLAVLPPTAHRRIRPFLRARRADIDRHVARHAVPFADDPSNVDPRYTRTRVRHEVLPMLARLDPGIVLHLCALADDLIALAPRDAHDAQNAEVARVDARALPRATREALTKLEASQNARGRVLLPGGRVARYEGVGRGKGRVIVEAGARRPRRV